ncbi:MAG TPA: nucleotidyltransferase substrate binding protein, partial [Candidatus Babeliales bacterium]|nr:nucleotidyltransferase substrate binding protein [Candidatus Babeliales bacterium]
MDIIKEKIVLFSGMLQKLETAIVLSCKYECLSNIEATKENKMLLRTMRDATFLRFKCCVDLFWKVLKLHLEEVENIELPINSPRAIVREAVTARLLTESEGREYM